MNNHTPIAAALELTNEELISAAVENGEGVIASNGALSTVTGERTGRSPNDRYIVKEPGTDDLIDWGEVNKPFEEDKFNKHSLCFVLSLVKSAGDCLRLKTQSYLCDVSI